MQTAENNAQAAQAAKYKVVNGTSYHTETPETVIDVLDFARRKSIRIRVHYGDTTTGIDWLDTYEVTGYVSRSTGTNKIPLIIHNSRSMGGPGILDHCIVKIKTTAGVLLYKQANYQDPKPEIVPGDMPEYPFNVLCYGKLHSRHRTERAAKMEVKSLS